MADMTDAERTSAQTDEQEEQEVQEQHNGGLLSKIVETAKNVVDTVTDAAKDVAGSVVDHTPAAVSSAVSTVSSATNSAVEKLRDHDEPSAEAPSATQTESTPTTETQPVAAVGAATEEATDAADSDAAQSPAEETSTVAELASAVRRRVSRVYDALTASTTPAAETGTDATQTEGATYQPAAEGGAKGGRPRRFKDVQPGMKLQGKVTSIALYGIFVDVGVGRDGLVHISEMSDKRIDTPTDLVQIGQQVDVWVKSVDPEARRISLTMRDPERAKPERQERRQPRKREVDRDRLSELKPGDTVEGVVSSLAPFGAFVDIGVGKDGLVHVSELAEGRVDRPEDAVQVGERYTFKVLEVDPDGNRISLSLRRAMRTQRMQQLERGTVMDGTISGIAPFGAFVDIGVGRDGLVHVSEISADRINSVGDAVKVGDKVKVKVLEVDPNSKRISLTMRVDEPMPNERPNPGPRAATGGAPSLEAPRYSPAPAYSSPSPSYGGPPPMEDSRGGDRRSGARRGGGRDERSGESDDYGRSDSRGSSRRDRGGDRGPRSGGGRSEGRGRRDVQGYEQPAEVYSTSEDTEEEAFTGDATLEDLLSKFNSGRERDRGRARNRNDRDDEDSGDDRADVIRRTLALRDED